VTPYAELKSKAAVAVPAVPQADVALLTHTMPGYAGGTTNATTLLFVPKTAPPAGGWPVVAWAHGTSTVAQKTCAPSRTLDTLDGGLTAEGFPSNYDQVIGAWIAAGYAVVAPDFEGLGDTATGRYPYYSSASEARSLIAGVKAARLANSALSKRWMAVGHSEGARGALALNSFIDEASELDFRGTVAYAPYVSIIANYQFVNGLVTADPANAVLWSAIQNHFVAMFATAIDVDSANLDQGQFMGPDLAALMPAFRNGCIFSAFNQVYAAVAAKGPAAFAGAKASWVEIPAVKAFFAKNDPATLPGFKLAAPAFVAQGTTDVFVPEFLTAKLVSDLTGRGSSVSYRVYTGSDHGSIVLDARSDALSFMAARFGQ
jgi:predicted esterase